MFAKKISLQKYDNAFLIFIMWVTKYEPTV